MTNKAVVNQIAAWNKTWEDMIERKAYLTRECGPYQRMWQATLIQTLQKTIPLDQLTNILECGCGNGIFGLEIGNRIPKAAICFSDVCASAISYNKILHQTLNTQFPKENFSKIQSTHVVEDMFALQQTDNQFDLVINGGTIEHYQNADAISLIKEMARVTKPSGYTVIVVPNIRNLDFLIKRTKQFLHRFSAGSLFRHLPIYGGNDERNITLSVFTSLLSEIPNIRLIAYHKHSIAWPRILPRKPNILVKILEPLFCILGFYWARIYILKKTI